LTLPVWLVGWTIVIPGDIWVAACWAIVRIHVHIHIGVANAVVVVSRVIVVVVVMRVDGPIVIVPVIIRWWMVSVCWSIARVNGAVRRWIVGAAAVIDVSITPCRIGVVVVVVEARSNGHADTEREKPDSNSGSSADST
jgi:hypothetical protein